MWLQKKENRMEYLFWNKSTKENELCFGTEGVKETKEGILVFE